MSKYRLKDHRLPVDILAIKGAYDKYHVLYMILNKINNKEYYGIFSRNKLFNGYAGSGIRLHKAYKHHGIDKFTMYYLAFFATRSELGLAEATVLSEEFINSDYCKDHCYNLRSGGILQSKLSEASRQKLSAAQRIYQTRPDIVIKKREMRYKYLAKLTPEDRAEIVAKQRLAANTPEVKAKIKTGRRKYFDTPGTVEAIRATAIAAWKRPEVRAKFIAARKAKWADPIYHAKQVAIG